MKFVICSAAFFVTLSSSLPVKESPSSAISVYTTLTPETAGPNVYQQLATNIAGKITSPILNFLGLNKPNTTQSPLKSHKPFDSLETFEQPMTPVDNALHPIERDVEEVTADYRTQNKKPEKYTLFSNYETSKDNATLDGAQDSNDGKPRDGVFTYFLEILGSIAQLAVGAFMAIFNKPATPSTESP